MNREEAQKRGHTIHPSKGIIKKRAPWHDYRDMGTYMLTMAVEGRVSLLGRLEVLPAPHIELSPLGQAILNEEVPKISRYYPNVEVWRVCIMPDHLHMIVHVAAAMPHGKHLGSVISGFKNGCNKAYLRTMTCDGAARGGKPVVPTMNANNVQPAYMATPLPAPCGSAAGLHPPLPSLFERGYNDQLLFDGEQLQYWKHYLDDNPRRLALKRQHPGLFTVIHGRQIGEWQCQMVGSIFLLDIPDKVAVIVHSAYSDADFARFKAQWLACGERGGVIVSAAIAPREREVLHEAMERGYRVIWLRENGFPPLYKPTGRSFDACIQGHLLQISPWDYHHEQRTISREQCLKLNRLAEEIVETPR